MIDKSDSAKYREHVRRVSEAQAEKTLAGQDIGEIPKCQDPDRRKRCAKSLPDFCKTYSPETFFLPWADFHYRAAEKMERAAMEGGLFAFAMPRGSGKTSLCEWMAIWAILNGHSNYVVLVGASETKAEARLQNVKSTLEVNELLAADYPEVLYPIHRLERSVRRCEGQKYKGKPTAIAWRQKLVSFPCVPDSIASGAVIEVAGLTGEIRGMVRTRYDTGERIRPTLAIVDDPQTRESAKSPTQSKDRERIIAADVAYLAGPAEPIAVVVPCTVIYQDDLADRLLDRDKHPEYQGERTRMVLKWPENEKKWAEYQELLVHCWKNDGDIQPATDFYLKHRKAMDKGAIVSWPERYIHGKEASAVQHVMNLHIRNPEAFASEFQNDPIVDQEPSSEELNPELILSKRNSLTVGRVPSNAVVLTCGMDVQKAAIYWMVVAWEQDCTGYVVDYGVFPEQRERQHSLTSLRTTLQSSFPQAGLEGQIYGGLTGVAESVLSREWGGGHRIDLAIVDANWGQSTNVVYHFCETAKLPTKLIPAHGKGVTASMKAWEHYNKARGQKLGNHWLTTRGRKYRPVRHAVYDTNYWKSWVTARWQTAMGDPGALSLYGKTSNGRDTSNSWHAAFVDQMTSEFAVRAESKGRVVDEWRLKSNRPDNHWWDCLVAAAVAGSMSGVELVGTPQPLETIEESPAITAETLRSMGRLAK